MTRTCIVNLGTGLVENVVEMGHPLQTPNAVEHTEPPQGYLFVASDTGQIGATYANGTFTAPTPAPSAPVPLPPPTPRQWLERLSPATQLALETAALTNAQVALWLRKATGNPSIDVTQQETRDGVAAMVAAGLLTAADQETLLAP